MNVLMKIKKFIGVVWARCMRMMTWMGVSGHERGVLWRGYIYVTDKVDKSIAFEVAQQFALKGEAKLKNLSAYLKGIDE